MKKNISYPEKSSFEEIKHIDENGYEFWTARELLPLLGYGRWESFTSVIQRAMKSAFKNGDVVENHFRQLTKMVKLGSNSTRQIDDLKLDRYACYLIAQNGDPTIEQVAHAQKYFVLQTRKQEIFQQLTDDQKRLEIRSEVTKENKKLFSTAKKSGVNNYGSFNDAGYRGLYGMPVAEVEKYKKINKGELLDRSGSAELAANLFRITQTEEKLRLEKTNSQSQANTIHNMVGGKVRQTIKDIGGTLPENLSPQQHIKDVKKALKTLNPKNNQNEIL